MANVDDIVRGLTKAQREIILRTPMQQPATAKFIAGDDIAPGTVAAFGRSHDFLFTRFQPTARHLVEYRLSPIGLEVRARLLSSSGAEIHEG